MLEQTNAGANEGGIAIGEPSSANGDVLNERLRYIMYIEVCSHENNNLFEYHIFSTSPIALQILNGIDLVALVHD